MELSVTTKPGDCSSEKMTITSLVVVFGWSFFLTGICAASTNVSVSKPWAQNGQGTTVASADNKCTTVVHGNYYAGANKETKAILQGIQAQLSEMQEQLREIKIFTANKTGEEKHQCFAHRRPPFKSVPL